MALCYPCFILLTDFKVLCSCFLFGQSWSHSFPLLSIFEFFPRFAYTGLRPLAVLLTGEENPNMAQNRKTAL